MAKIRLVILIFIALFFSSCEVPENNLQAENIIATDCGGDDVSNNLAHYRGTVYKYTGILSETLGTIGNLIDGSEATVFGFSRRDPVIPVVKAFAGYQIDLDSEYFVENIQVSSAAVGYFTKFYGMVYVITQNGQSFNVTNIGNFGFTNESVKEMNYEELSTFDVQANIIGLRVSIDIDGAAGVIDTYGVIKEIYANGIDRAESKIKVHTITGMQLLAKNNKLHGPLRYMSGSGIESLGVVSVNAPKASSVRIMTPSGIKAIAKL